VNFEPISKSLRGVFARLLAFQAGTVFRGSHRNALTLVADKANELELEISRGARVRDLEVEALRDLGRAAERAAAEDEPQ